MAGVSDQSSDIAFLNDGGELGALMREHDWSSSLLGEPKRWPQSLRSVVQLMLNNRQLMFIAWGEDLAFLYNDGYAPTFGAKHPWALGRPFREVWSEIWEDIEPLVTRALAGETTYDENFRLVMQRNGYPEDAWFTFSYSPLRDESGQIAGMFCAGIETTARVLEERRREALLRLDDRLRDVPNTADLSFAASQILGETMGAVRVGYGILDCEARTIAVERNWGAPGFADVAGLHRFDDYGTYIEELLHGTAVANSDVEADGRTAGNVAAFRALRCRAHLDVPVMEGSRAVAQMFVHSAAPRAWTSEDVAFVRNFAERTRGAIGRARAEAGLRESEARLAFLDRLSAETASPADADAVLATTTRLLGDHLRLSVCAYADMDADEDGFTIRGDWSAPGSASIVGHYSLTDFGRLAVNNLRAGRPLVVNDNLRELAPGRRRHSKASGSPPLSACPSSKRDA